MTDPAGTRPPHAVRRTRRQFKLAVDRFGMIDEGETVVAGVSGGADSLALIHLLHWYNARRKKGWDIRAVHVHPGFEGWDSARIGRACARLGVDLIERRIDVPARIRATQYDSCFFCARERRKALFRTATELGARRVALAHNMDDVNETFLMNLLMAASGTTFVPCQELFRGTLIVVRPLYYLDSGLIRRYLRSTGVRPVRNRCPFEKSGTRMVLRRFLKRLYRGDRRIRTNLFWGMHNLKPQYLPRAPRPGLDRSD